MPSDIDQTRIQELEAEVERLTALLEGRYKDVRLVEIKNGEMVLEGSVVAYMASFLAEMLKSRGTVANYTETRVTDPELGELVLTLQRVSGKTPHQLRRDAEAERDGARAGLQAMVEEIVQVETGLGLICDRAHAGEIESGGRAFARHVWSRFAAARDHVPAPVHELWVQKLQADRQRRIENDIAVPDLLHNSGSDFQARLAAHVEAMAPFSQEAIETATAAQILQNLVAVTESRVFHKVAEEIRRFNLTDTDPKEEVPETWKEERTGLITALHDAIRRPMGVVPDSAQPWYDVALADEAESRRPRHPAHPPSRPAPGF